ncbi:uncharacterized protein K441DRAFT_84158 [Cenococcum geophilum 1.58]|uniref:uncharacterized protein n=1 Tax=Cenococcum geophilum 1.58 TaxID=794803 RepID=UPI00358E3031|nr:hypothetical protein K441DRAFT_84158 [Cenococcum geophilum 1.58]
MRCLIMDQISKMFSWRTGSGRNRAMIQELPDELLLEIAFLLQDKIGNHTDDLLALCKVSKALARTAQEVLFQNCCIGGTLAPKRLGLFLRTILNRTDLARKVRKLEITVTQRYAWTRTHPSWTNMDGTTTDTVAFLSNCVRDLKLPIYSYMEQTWLGELRIRAHDSHIAVVALVLARVRKLRSLHLILAEHLEMPPLLVQLCSMHPSLILGALEDIHITRGRDIFSLSQRGVPPLLRRRGVSPLLRLPSLRSVQVEDTSDLTVHTWDINHRNVEISTITSLTLRGKVYQSFNGQILRCFTALRSFTCHFHSDFSLENVLFALGNQQNTLETLRISTTSYLRNRSPIGSFAIFTRLKTLQIPQGLLLGDHESTPPLLVNVLPRSLERLELDTTWIRQGGADFDTRLVEAIPGLAPQLDQIHFHRFSKANFSVLVQCDCVPLKMLTRTSFWDSILRKVRNSTVLYW